MKYIILLLSVIIASCDLQQEPEFSFEIKEWAKDKNACNGFRNEHKAAFIEKKDAFLKWPERQVTSFMGRPDRHRLSKRHQKFYVYFLEPGRQCDENGEEYGEFIQLRFDAVGYVSEVEIRNDFEKLVD